MSELLLPRPTERDTGSVGPFTVYLGLGSNTGDRRKMMIEAVNKLKSLRELSLIGASSLYETEPVGYRDQPFFLNAVVKTMTSMSPHDLLRKVKSIERELGRQDGPRWGPREIDIDILLYLVQESPGSSLRCLNVEEGRLRLPHPMMTERLFVMAPLAEIAPDLRLCGHGSAVEIASRLEGAQRVKKVENRNWLG